MSGEDEKPPEHELIEEGQFREQNENALAVVPPRDIVLSTQDAEEFIARAVKQADALKSIIDKKNLAIYIGGGKKPHVLIDGWMTLMALNGVMPYTVSVDRQRDDNKLLTAYVVTEIRRVSDGFVLTRVESSCSQHEPRWSKAEDYAVVSMAQTRGVGKGCRQLFGWVMALAGYDATPAEEMPHSDGGLARPVTPQPGDADARPLTPMDEESKAAIQAEVKKLGVAISRGDAKAIEMQGHWQTWFNAQNGPKSWANLFADDRYTYAAITLLGLKRDVKEAIVPKQEPLPANPSTAGTMPPAPPEPKIPPVPTSLWDEGEKELTRRTYEGVQHLAKEGNKRAIEALAKFTAFMETNKLNWTGQRGMTSLWMRPEMRDEIWRILEILPVAPPEPKGFDPDEVPA